MKLQKYRIEYSNGMIQEKYLIPNGVDFFLEKSPMGEAMKTGKLILPEQQGGTHEVKITLLSEQGKQEEGEIEHYCHICGDHDGKHNPDCTAHVPGIQVNPSI